MWRWRHDARQNAHFSDGSSTVARTVRGQHVNAPCRCLRDNAIVHSGGERDAMAVSPQRLADAQGAQWRECSGGRDFDLGVSPEFWSGHVTLLQQRSSLLKSYAEKVRAKLTYASSTE